MHNQITAKKLFYGDFKSQGQFGQFMQTHFLLGRPFYFLGSITIDTLCNSCVIMTGNTLVLIKNLQCFIKRMDIIKQQKIQLLIIYMEIIQEKIQEGSIRIFCNIYTHHRQSVHFSNAFSIFTPHLLSPA